MTPRSQMSRVQRFSAAMLGSKAASAMEEQSRGWLFKCLGCGFTRSVWDTGGVRYKSSGGYARRIMSCPRCGRTGWHALEKDPGATFGPAPTWPLVRAIVGLVVTVWIVVAAILLAVFKLIGII